MTSQERTINASNSQIWKNMDTGKSYMIKQVSPGFTRANGSVEVR